MRRRKKQPWFNDIHARLRFERGACDVASDLRARTVGRAHGATIIYTATLDIPEYEQRQITITFLNGFSPYSAQVRADGPADSPHRFADGHLCLWHPRDPEHLKWVPADGLAALLALTRIHLFKEAWYREAAEWLGPEAPHVESHIPEPEQENAA